MEDKKIKLFYFTGTGNSLRVLEIMKKVFEKNGKTVHLCSITDGLCYDKEKYAYIGISFPVYSWGVPRVVRRFLANLPKVNYNQKVFVVATMGGKDEEGWALVDARKILMEKGYIITNSDSINMPNNWIVLSNPPSRAKAKIILDEGEEKAGKFAHNVLSNIEQNKKFIWPKIGLLALILYYLFKYCGIYHMWRMFRANERCISCNLCSTICPTKSIMIIDGKPKWTSVCEQCMRCINFCPEQAIEQLESIGKGSKRDRYHEPHYNPLTK
ncbi:EFR1 family ferrodoxin [Phosphitispora sp. TUW77]|uniref:EFR1 family ferrodoxin n=1 Tax=Phosphitispora sp. TUW77 TaxID=3152361 RepID=UPI003AB8749D